MSYRAVWPTFADIQNRLNASAGTAGIWQLANPTTAAITLDAVIDEAEQRTKRQWIADDEDTTRVYDGTGTAELEVDEMVSLTGCSAIGFQENPGFPLADVTLAQGEIGKPRTRIVMSRGGIPAWGPAGVLSPVHTIFPAGRQNIQVTGKFGYASIIPADLWDAVCGEAAIRLVRQGLFTPNGRVIEEKFGDESRKYSLTDAESLGWHAQFEETITRRKRSQGKRLRRLRGGMID